MRSKCKRTFLLVVLFISTMARAQQYEAKYIDLGHQSAALYTPAQPSGKSRVGVVVMHSHQDYMGFIANGELARRGYTVLATAPRGADLIEAKAISIKACVDYLREQPDIDKVVLLGHSGGGTVISAYEYLAEQGRKGLEGKLYQDYSDRIDHLPQADGIMLLDANPGLSTIMINSLDPNVTDEQTGRITSARYSYDRPREYMRGQQERYARLVATAQDRLALIKEGKGLFADDEPFIIPGANSMRFYNKLYSSDITLLSHTRKAWPQIHADGSIVTEIIRSVRAPFQPKDHTELLSAAESLTVRSFLSSYAMTTSADYEVTEDGFAGLQFDSNLTSPIGNIKGIRIPTLIMGMTGSYEYLTSEPIYENSPAADKTLVFVQGAGHMFVPDRKAEAYNNADYGDTVKNMFDYVDGWLTQHFAE